MRRNSGLTVLPKNLYSYVSLYRQSDVFPHLLPGGWAERSSFVWNRTHKMRMKKNISCFAVEITKGRISKQKRTHPMICLMPINKLLWIVPNDGATQTDRQTNTDGGRGLSRVPRHLKSYEHIGSNRLRRPEFELAPEHLRPPFRHQSCPTSKTRPGLDRCGTYVDVLVW